MEMGHKYKYNTVWTIFSLYVNSYIVMPEISEVVSDKFNMVWIRTSEKICIEMDL
jgi:hypothetical protein